MVPEKVPESSSPMSPMSHTKHKPYAQLILFPLLLVLVLVLVPACASPSCAVTIQVKEGDYGAKGFLVDIVLLDSDDQLEFKKLLQTEDMFNKEKILEWMENHPKAAKARATLNEKQLIKRLTVTPGETVNETISTSKTTGKLELYVIVAFPENVDSGADDVYFGPVERGRACEFSITPFTIEYVTRKNSRNP